MIFFYKCLYCKLVLKSLTKWEIKPSENEETELKVSEQKVSEQPVSGQTNLRKFPGKCIKL